MRLELVLLLLLLPGWGWLSCVWRDTWHWLLLGWKVLGLCVGRFPGMSVALARR